MFINRLNFILLLALVCKVDLKTQLLNLLEGIENAKDIKLIKLASQGVCVLTEIAIQRDTKLPIEVFPLLYNVVSMDITMFMGY